MFVLCCVGAASSVFGVVFVLCCVGAASSAFGVVFVFVFVLCFIPDGVICVGSVLLYEALKVMKRTQFYYGID